jgi:hypothetical protein
MTLTKSRGTLGSVAPLLAAMCYWNVPSYKWKVHNGKIEIISFVVNLGIK